MKLAVLTTGRQDWGILWSTCRAVREDVRFDLALLAGGTHVSAAFGRTESAIEEDGFEIAERLDWITGNETEPAEQAGRATALVAGALRLQEPDALLIVGDRFETAAAAIAATLSSVPIVHLHGGEVTEGAFDDLLRNAITKLSHLHLVSHDDHRRRVLAMGERPDSVIIVGAPGLDNLHRAELPDRAELEASLGIELASPVVVVTVHPTTLATATVAEVDAVLHAMQSVSATYVVTLPNIDPGHEAVRERLKQCAGRERCVVVEALGPRRFWGLLQVAAAMLGNSSSALIEAPAVELPAVNVGERQLGRVRGDNVIDAPADAASVSRALEQALDESFRDSIRGRPGPFGSGHSAERIIEVLGRWSPPKPPRKPPVVI